MHGKSPCFYAVLFAWYAVIYLILYSYINKMKKL